MFGWEFKRNLDNTTLPSGLQSLTFGRCVNQSSGNAKLPSRDRVEVGVRHVRIFGIELKRIERVRGRRDVPVESRAV